MKEVPVLPVLQGSTYPSRSIVVNTLMWYKTRPESDEWLLGVGYTHQTIHTHTGTTVGVPGKPGRQLGYVED